MKIRKAVITAAGQSQRRLPLQNLIDRDGQERSVLAILIEETSGRRSRRSPWWSGRATKPLTSR
jgi:hypothetical protein